MPFPECNSIYTIWQETFSLTQSVLVLILALLPSTKTSILCPIGDDDPPEKRQILLDRFFDSIPKHEAETFAHTYAERHYATLAAQNRVPPC